MKKALILIALSSLLATPMAMAREFYSVPVRARLYYSNPDTDKVRMGTLKGTLRAADDGAYAELVLDDVKYPFRLNRFKMDSDRRPHIDLVFGKDTIAQMLRAANDSWLRKKALKQHVSALVERYVAGGAIFEGGYPVATAGHYGYWNESLHLRTYQFHDDQSAEALHLRIELGTRVRVR